GERGCPSDYAQLLARCRERVRRSGAERLLSVTSDRDVPHGVKATIEVLKRGMPMLLDATVAHDGFAVRFDALRRRPGSPAPGELPGPADSASSTTSRCYSTRTTVRRGNSARCSTFLGSFSPPFRGASPRQACCSMGRDAGSRG